MFFEADTKAAESSSPRGNPLLNYGVGYLTNAQRTARQRAIFP
jgi:hypothetical protein